MKDITMFTLQSCPYCVRARAWMEEVLSNHPQYKNIPLTIIDEGEQPEVADRYDYYYVPTYYVDGKKVHEGAASLEIVRKVFAAAGE